ncbi:MAG TPA: NlpC/P60 family protein [Microvirga sp.]|nr:NlpC/P60 family protein [Microvirga sp.]
MSFDRRVTPYRPDLADERLRGRVDAERFATGAVKRVIAPSAPLHRHPSREGPLDTEALMGELVTVYDEHEGWAWGQLHADGYVGYLPRDALGDPGPEPTHKVRAIRTFVYPGPNMKLPYMGFLSFGARVAVADVDGEFARLATGGFVFAQHLAEAGAHEPDFVAVAERFLHTPYLWGGKTSLGIDCSGLTQIALVAAGIAAPRDSDMLERDVGTPVAVEADLSGLRRGDLVFWKGHVGMMADATRLLHATAYTMTTYLEPLAVAEERIRLKSFGAITSIKRLPALGG